MVAWYSGAEIRANPCSSSAARLTQALLEVEFAAAMAPQRAALLLHGLARISAPEYHATIEAADQADAMGYPHLA